jgi:histidinol dehydrogenase
MKVYKNPKQSEWEQLCSRPALWQEDLDKLCLEVFETIKAKGDQALKDYTKQFDGVSLDSVILDEATVKLLANKTPQNLKRAIDEAYKNIFKFHESQVLKIKIVETRQGVRCWQESRAVERVGVYIPGGSAPLISTVLMLGVPAKIAGCREIVLATPPQQDGKINAAICYAAQKVGVTKIVMAGGVQAIASLAVGTESVLKVDKIFGPGNQYVTAAKQYAGKYGVAIDIPAGPSEVMVVADETANPAFVAADLLSQAEHGPDSQAVLVATSMKIVSEVNTQLTKQLMTLPRKDIAQEALSNSFGVVLSDVDECLSFANTYAPEHIILSVSSPKEWASKVASAGSVFLGNYSPESAGDYASGTNHTLPTAGWAKSYGGVSLDSFVKKITFQELTDEGLQKLGPTIEVMAEAEGLMAHARAVTIRTQAK